MNFLFLQNNSSPNLDGDAWLLSIWCCCICFCVKSTKLFISCVWYSVIKTRDLQTCVIPYWVLFNSIMIPSVSFHSRNPIKPLWFFVFTNKTPQEVMWYLFNYHKTSCGVLFVMNWRGCDVNKLAIRWFLSY